MMMVDYRNLFWKDLYLQKHAEPTNPPNQPLLLMVSMLVKQGACFCFKERMIFPKTEPVKTLENRPKFETGKFR